MLERLGAIDFATTIAPGLRDVLLTGKVYEAVAPARADGGPVYDAVVLDAPPTGRSPGSSTSTRRSPAWPRSGPIRNQADSIMTLLRCPQTVVHLVTAARGDAGAGDARRRRATCAPSACRVGMRRRQHGPRAGAARHADLSAPPRAGSTGTSCWPASRPPGSAAARDRRPARCSTASSTACSPRAPTTPLRVALEQEQRVDLADARAADGYELPALAGGIDLGALYDLADLLVEQGVA